MTTLKEASMLTVPRALAVWGTRRVLAAGLLLLGAQVISEFERLGEAGSGGPPVGWRTG